MLDFLSLYQSFSLSLFSRESSFNCYQPSAHAQLGSDNIINVEARTGRNPSKVLFIPKSPLLLEEEIRGLNCSGAITIVPIIIFSLFTLFERSKQKIKEFNVCLPFVKSLLHR